MKVVALISGGKDSCFNMMQCIAAGHEITALANLTPISKTEIDSYMYQSVGFEAIDFIAAALDFPLYRHQTRGVSHDRGKVYEATNDEDEVEDLHKLLRLVKEETGVEAVSVGAILSDYQRVRVENVCTRLGLVPLAYLWQRDQKELLNEMIKCEVDAIVIKVAALGLDPYKHLGRTLSSLLPHLHSMHEKYGLNVCGEGGEYESLTLDCPMFKSRIVIEDSEVILHSNDPIAPVGYLKLLQLSLEIKLPALDLQGRFDRLPLKDSDGYVTDYDGIDAADLDELKPSVDCSDSPEENVTTNRTRVVIDQKPTFSKSSDGCLWIGGLQSTNEDFASAMEEVAGTLQSILTENGHTVQDVCSVGMFISDMGRFAELNRIYCETFKYPNPPSRACVEVPSTNPLTLTALSWTQPIQTGDFPVERQTMHVQSRSHWAPANIGPYSQAVKIGDFIHLAGQIGLVPGSLELVKGGVKSQCQLALRHVGSLAEWGSVRLMETELRAKSKFLRTIIKAAGLWHPHVNSNTSANFKVDRRHHLISLASMLGPTPDWVVGITGLNLCLKNCSWTESLNIDLFPYDAGTDSGISYMSPNSESNPRERMYRITTTYPEDPRAPFYDPHKKEMAPLARLYLKREKLIPKNCDESFLTAQLDVSENTEEVSRPECAVTDYTPWSECSVTCGKGLSMRTREYRLPQKAKMFNCNRQLVSKEMCVAAISECGNQEANNEASEENLDVEPLPEANEGICSTTPWSPWSQCSASCDAGFIMRTRLFLDKMGRKKCPHVTTQEKEKCMGPACSGLPAEVADPMCPTTEWSDWSPCSASCGKGVKFRTRLLLVEPGLQQKCSSRVELMQQSPCMDTPDCSFDMATAKVVCMEEKEQGPCTGYFNRWYFESRKLMCVPFIFGGCRGNRNNFLTAQECMDSCGVVREALGGSPLPRSDVSRNDGGFGQSPSVIASLPPVDCMISPWSNWSPCSATCGIGTSERFRMIKREPENGGKACPRKLLSKKRCAGPPCF